MSDIVPSPELEAVTRRWMAALTSGDADTRVSLFAADNALTYVGTAERKVWNADMLRHGYAAYAQAVPVAEAKNIEVSAFECGDVGWSFWTALIHFANSEREIRFRASLVFVLEKGSWKVVQVHNSTPTENVENLGFDYSVLDDLVEAARAISRSRWSGVTTIMFTDVANSSTLANAIGDARWAERIGQHFEIVHEVIAARGGRLVKSLGDGTMSTFASARSAMEAARAIQRNLSADTAEPRLQVRIGMHTGEVQQTTDDFFGTVVNKAARIAASAGPGEIRMSEATRLMVGGSCDLAFSEPASVVLRGFDGEHALYRLEWQE